ncbi:MAG TPA: hypothetical protein VN857_09255, partial [Chthoniobacterales bacterium]|nr:hypothetical protein [Chthoniobacterales bacterium]
DGQRLRDPRRLHEQVTEAALAGELRYLDGRRTLALFLDRGRGRQPATGQPNTASVATKYRRINMFSESVIARPLLAFL